MKIRRGIMGGALLFVGGCVPSGNTPTTDTSAPCYEAPADPAAWVGTACEWPDAVECTTDPWIKCLGGKWELFPEISGTATSCEPAIVDCAPAGKVKSEILGVGFVGITRAGMERQATRSLRRV